MKRSKNIPPAAHDRLSAGLAQNAADTARETVAGAVLCCGAEIDLALLLDLARPTDQRAPVEPVQ